VFEGLDCIFGVPVTAARLGKNWQINLKMPAHHPVNHEWIIKFQVWRKMEFL
jgi:hypothetical protein